MAGKLQKSAKKKPRIGAKQKSHTKTQRGIAAKERKERKKRRTKKLTQRRKEGEKA
jgi:hypothetical protein